MTLKRPGSVEPASGWSDELSDIISGASDRHRIVNYDYYQTKNICAIASGAVESTVKPIDRRLRIIANLF